MKQIPLLLPFLLALVYAVFGTALLPGLHLSAFAPFLAITLMRKGFIPSLWIAALSGLVLDLLNSEMRFGLYALNFSLTALLLHAQKKHFFDDRPFALALFTAVISSVSTLLQYVLLSLFDQKLPLSFGTALSDLVGMPLLDGVYAFIWFNAPIRFYLYARRIGWRNLFKKQAEFQ